MHLAQEMFSPLNISDEKYHFVTPFTKKCRAEVCQGVTPCGHGDVCWEATKNNPNFANRNGIALGANEFQIWHMAENGLVYR